MSSSRRRDSGLAMILVVALILVSVVLVFASFVLFADADEKVRLQASLKKEQARLQAEEQAIKARMKEAVEPIGVEWKEGEEIPTVKVKERAQKTREEYLSADRLGQLPLPEPKALSPEAVQKLEKAREDSTLYSTLQEQVILAAAWAGHVRNRCEQLQLELEIAKEQAANRERIRPEVSVSRQAEKDRLQKDIAEEAQRIAQENEEANARKGKLGEARTLADQEIAVEAEKSAADDLKYTNEIRELRRRLEELKTKEVIKLEISAVHGKVLEADVPNKTAFIDLGSRDRVMPGLQFLAGRRGPQGKFDYKGKVEVKKVWATHSEVSIVEAYDKDRPIVEADLLVNPLFSSSRPVVVAFVGEDRAFRLRYATDEASRRIREIGSEVRSEVGLDVDFVIFTEASTNRQRDSYDAFRKAVLLELPIAEASEIYRFLGD